MSFLQLFTVLLTHSFIHCYMLPIYLYLYVNFMFAFYLIRDIKRHYCKLSSIGGQQDVYQYNLYSKTESYSMVCVGDSIPADDILYFIFY